MVSSYGGENLQCTKICSNIPIALANTQLHMDFFVLPISGANRIQWLQTLGPIITNYATIIKGIGTKNFHDMALLQIIKEVTPMKLSIVATFGLNLKFQYFKFRTTSRI